ncbi:hypothetical protein VUR80DRAFT_46 [Thermomyces stellatus]
MATIEPRLIHLLNDATTPHLPTSELPPLQSPGSKPPDRLPLLEPDADNQNDKTGPSAVHPPYVTDDTPTLRGIRTDSKHQQAGRGHANGSHSLRLLLEVTAVPGSSSSLSKILSDDGPDGVEDFPSNKRQRTIPVKEDLVQLPQPVNKQQASQQQAMPPIINGLLEPPPDAALFPPISSNTFNDPEANQLNLLREFTHVNEDRSQAPPKSESSKPGPVKTRRRSGKPRKKWTEEETRNLLLAVDRYGIGRWTKILEDPSFTFNDRSAGDLKDRFRTCCPDEFLAKGRDNSNAEGTTGTPRHNAKSGLLAENILISTGKEGSEQPSTAPPATDPPAKPKKTRAHRKKVEDLAELGIHGPFKKSHRRKGQPFTEEDDKQIREGLEIYGPAWTKIQREPRFNFAHRQPTDLRDRVRNKFPDLYQMIEKGLFQAKDPNHGSELLEPSVNMTIENSLTKVPATPVETPLNRPNSGDEALKWGGPAQGPELPELIVPQSGNTGEMDISRFLVEDRSGERRKRKPSKSSSPVNGVTSHD